MASVMPPSVSVGIPTRDRPELLRRAIDSIRSQQYEGPVEIVVVYDGTEPDLSLEGIEGVRVLPNCRAAGLAGARNTAILGTDAELVAFCDDDDRWLPGKLSAQVARFAVDPSVEFCSTAINVRFGSRTSSRWAGGDRITYRQLLRSRMSMLHSSTFLVRRDALMSGIGLIDEDIPSGQNEDWDLLLRAAARRDIAHVDSPLVEVLWGASSHFSRRFEMKVEAHQWLLQRHPDLGADRTGASLVHSQIAFAQACLGQSRQARASARLAMRNRPTQWRAPVAYAVAAGLVEGETVLNVLHRFGRGV